MRNNPQKRTTTGPILWMFAIWDTMLCRSSQVNNNNYYFVYELKTKNNKTVIFQHSRARIQTSWTAKGWPLFRGQFLPYDNDLKCQMPQHLTANYNYMKFNFNSFHSGHKIVWRFLLLFFLQFLSLSLSAIHWHRHFSLFSFQIVRWS